MRIIFILILLASSVSSIPLVRAETVRSAEFMVQTNVTAPPTPTPTPTPFTPVIQTGFRESQNAKPLRLTLSRDTIDFGHLTATNPVIRQISISVDPGSTPSYSLFTFEDHPLKADDMVIADTTCDSGDCSEKRASAWINPLTFGFGFSFSANGRPPPKADAPLEHGSDGDGNLYQQFPDSSQKEPMSPITPGKMTIKLNISRNQAISPETPYENTIRFLVIPKY